MYRGAEISGRLFHQWRAANRLRAVKLNNPLILEILFFFQHFKEPSAQQDKLHSGGGGSLLNVKAAANNLFFFSGSFRTPAK